MGSEIFVGLFLEKIENKRIATNEFVKITNPFRCVFETLPMAGIKTNNLKNQTCPGTMKLAHFHKK